MDTRWTPTVKLVVLVSILVFAAWLLVQFGAVVPPLLVAFIVAYLLKPPTDWLVRRTGWPRGLAVILVMGALLALLILAPVLVSPSVAAIIASVRLDVSALNPLWERLSSEVFQIGPIEIDGADLTQQVTSGLQNLITPFASGAFQIVSGVAASLFWTVFVLVVVFWLVKDSYKLESWIIAHVPLAHREEITQLLRELGAIWSGFFRGALVLAFVIGALVGISMWILGLPNVLLLALISGVMEFVPTVGPVIAALPGVLVAWLLGSRWLDINPLILVIIVAAVYAAIFQIESIYLLPRIVGRRVRLHPGVVFVGTIVGATQIGLLGVLIAAPVIASARLFGGYIYRKLLDVEPFVALASSVVAPEIGWRGMIRGQAIAGVLFDLDGTVIDSDDQSVEKLSARLGALKRLFPDRDPRPFVRHLLMLAEGPITWLITHLDRLDLDDEGFRLNDLLRRALGYRLPAEMALIPGVEPVLRELKANYRLALVTTRSRRSTTHFLEITGLDDVFEVIVTRDDVRFLKPHPEPLLLACSQLGLKPERCVMVGDTSADMRAAQAAGCRSVGVLCGFGLARDLEEADLVLDSTAELTDWL